MSVACVVLGGYVNGYSIVQELYANGVREIILLDTHRSLAAHSNRLRRFVQIDSTPHSLQEALERLRADYSYIVVYPTSDEHLADLHKIHDAVAGFCFLPFNDQTVIASISKVTQFEHCSAHGIPYPPSVVIHVEEEFDRLAELAFPVIVKPESRGDRGVAPFRNLVLDSSSDRRKREQELRRAVRGGCALLVSEVVPGDSNIYAYVAYRSKRGEIKNEWVGRKLSQYPDRFGVFATATNQAPDVVADQGRHVIQTMDLWGVCEPEFKFDRRDGTYRLMEVNLRPMMWNRMGHLAGVDLMYAQYLDALGRPSVRRQQDRDREIHLVYAKYELLGLLRRTIPLRDVVRDVVRSDRTALATFDLADLRPFLADWASLIPDAVRHVRHRLRSPQRS